LLFSPWCHLITTCKKSSPQTITKIILLILTWLPSFGVKKNGRKLGRNTRHREANVMLNANPPFPILRKEPTGRCKPMVIAIKVIRTWLNVERKGKYRHDSIKRTPVMASSKPILSMYDARHGGRPARILIQESLSLISMSIFYLPFLTLNIKVVFYTMNDLMNFF